MNQINGLPPRDEQALREIYNLHSAALLGIINNIVQEEKAAELVLEEMFIKIWQDGDSYEDGYQRLFSWLSIKARAAAHNHINTREKINAREKINTKNPDINLPEVFDLIFFKGLSQAAAAEQLNVPVEHVRRDLRNKVLLMRS
jgi:DNA-directed RNA polymerase specialized sigma24 family protein